MALNRKYSVKSRSSGGSRIQVGENLSISQDNEKKLVDYIIKRFEFGQQIRDQFVQKLEKIDREFSGFIKLDQDDMKRKKEVEQGKSVKPYDVNLPLVDVQIDEAATLLMSILAPDSDLYGAITTKEKQAITNGIVQRMNEHGDQFKHYNELCQFITNALKYNAAAGVVDWVEVFGKKLVVSETSERQIKNDIVKRGNEVKNVDLYNFMWDISKPFTQLNTLGEFFATFDTETLFRVKKLKADGEIFNCERFLQNDMPKDIAFSPKYYKLRPQIAEETDPLKNGPLDFTSILTYGQQHAGLHHLMERADVYIWIDPTQFGLAPANSENKDQMEIWKIIMFNSQYIVSAERVENAYGTLPIVTSMPRIDGFGLQTSSHAQMLMPFQRFSSFSFNVHQRSSRASLYGKTFYDSRVIPEKTEDTEAGMIPVKLTGLQDVDIRKALVHYDLSPETRYILDDIGKTNDIMQKILPTDLLKQVTDLQRATEYQAAAVVQGSNRRGHKMAKVIDDQAFTDMRFMQFINIIYFEQQIMVIDEQGKSVPTSPAPALEANVQFSISGGLRGLDKMYVIAFYKEMFTALVQSGKIQEVDVLGLLDYIAGLVGDKMDITQFKIQNPFDALPPEEKQKAFALYQQQQMGMAEGTAPGTGAAGANLSAIPGGRV